MRFKLKFLSVLLLLAPCAYAEDAASPAKTISDLPEPLRIFGMNCINSLVSSEDAVKAKLNSDPAVMQYDPQLTKMFLGDAPGKAWGFRGKESTYVVAIAENHTCMVYAANAKTDGVLPGLGVLLDTLFPKIERAESKPPFPDTERTTSKLYALGLKGRPLAGATINTDPQYNFSVKLVLVPRTQSPEG